MKPVLFEGHDLVLGAPEGWNEKTHGPCDGLPVMRHNGYCISMWELTNDERAAIAGGARVRLHVLSGQTQPPVILEVGMPDHDPGGMELPIIMTGDGTISGTQLVDVRTMRALKNVLSFTTYGTVKDKGFGEPCVEARVEVSGDALLLGDPMPDAVGLRCTAFIMARSVDGS